MVSEPTLVIQVPEGSAIGAELPAQVIQGAGRHVVVETGPTDAQGRLEAPAAGEVVLSVPSPEALAREAGEVRRVIAQAGTGVEPLVVVVEAADELREDELAAVIEAAGHTSRAVILRIVGGG